jgi:cyclic AMP-dependent transcription factor ATF-2
MDSQSAHFFDYMDLGGSYSYQSPESNQDDDAICLDPFNPYAAKEPTTDFMPMADLYVDFPNGEVEPLPTQAQKELFVDPELYSPESSEDTKAQIRVEPQDTSRLSTRKTSSTKSPSHRTSKSASSSTDITRPDQEPPRKRRARKMNKESSTAEEDQKRNKFLERNRIAASKCREKKKMYVSELEQTEAEYAVQNAHLRALKVALTAEASDLKNQLMGHGTCNDSNIDRWIKNQASNYVQTTPERLGQPFLPAGQYPAPELSTASPRSRNPSNASSYPALQGMRFDGLPSSGQRQGSITYSHGESKAPKSPEGAKLNLVTLGSGPLYPSPTTEAFPALKREPDLTYNPVSDPMFSPDQSTFPGGS